MCDSEEILQKASEICSELLPTKSRSRYEAELSRFMDWRLAKNVQTFSENAVMVYFEELSKKYKSSTLWTIFSMLKSTLSANHNIDLGSYKKLQALIKRKSENYVPKKSQILTEDDFCRFLTKASDDKYLLIKAVVAVGLSGACRREELCYLKIEDTKDFGSAMLIKLKNTKTKVPRCFTITGNLYTILKKYCALRPPNLKTGRFFLNYQNGKCSSQNVGINKIGNMAREIAKFLMLENPESYTGHCFRRSSATILVNSGSNLLALKRHGGWKSSTVAEGYVDDCLRNKMEVSKKIESSVSSAATEPEQRSSTGIQQENNDRTLKNCTKNTTPKIFSITENKVHNNTAFPSVTLKECSNVTINIKY
jgi:Integrase